MELNVLYTLNDKYIDIMLVSLTSLVLNNKTYSKIRFFIVCADFKASDYQKLENYISKFSNAEVFFYPLDEFKIDKFNIPDWRGNQVANARLFYQSIINDDSIEKLLYLDSDTIVVGDLGELNSSSNKIMAVKDGCLKAYINSLGLDKYYNSGVLFFDTKKWMDDCCEEKIVQFLKNGSGRKLTYPDQDILNLVLGSEIVDLDLKYNMGPWFMADYDIFLFAYFNRMIRQIEYFDVKKAVLEPKILHNYGNLGMKPWVDNKMNPFRNEFMKYMELVNPNFKREELTGLRKVICSYDKVFYTLLAIKSYLADSKISLENKMVRRKIKDKE